MLKDILKDIDTLALGNGFYFCRNELYFFSPEELNKIKFDTLEKLLQDFNINA